MSHFLICLSLLGVAGVDLDGLESDAFRAAAARVAPSVVQIELVGGAEHDGKSLLGTGPVTGTVVDADGWIVTSAFHLLSKPQAILVKAPEGKRYAARLMATDHAHQLVLLKIEPDSPLPVPEGCRREGIRVGQWAIAVGRTFSFEKPNLTVGIVSATSRMEGKAIQTDAAVSPNNYGGPLVDIRGQVLGVLVPLSPQSNEALAGTEWYDSGIGFAVPWESIVTSIFPRLRKGDSLFPGRLGVRFASQNSNTGEPVVASVKRGSAVEEAGLRPGDRIVEVQGQAVSRIATLASVLGPHYAGEEVQLVIERDGKRLTRSVTLTK